MLEIRLVQVRCSRLRRREGVVGRVAVGFLVVGRETVLVAALESSMCSRSIRSSSRESGSMESSRESRREGGMKDSRERRR